MYKIKLDESRCTIAIENIKFSRFIAVSDLKVQFKIINQEVLLSLLAFIEKEINRQFSD